LKIRCMLCGMPLEDDLGVSADPRDNDYDDDMPVKKPLTVCLRCQAKLKHEADGTQKVPKPM
jgi:ferredoxin